MLCVEMLVLHGLNQYGSGSMCGFEKHQLMVLLRILQDRQQVPEGDDEKDVDEYGARIGVRADIMRRMETKKDDYETETRKENNK